VKIEDVKVNMTVRLEMGEEGNIKEINYDDHMLVVSVPLANGRFDTVEVDPEDVEAVL
jgi:hypothetical protein